MLTVKSKAYRIALPLLLLPLLVQGCLGSVQYRSTPYVQTGTHTDVFDFSSSDMDASAVDLLYQRVAAIMNITPDNSKPRPQVLIVPPAHIHQEYLRLHHSAKTQNGIALALYIPHANRILVPEFDRTLLIHELAHYFTFHYLSVSRSRWEAIADRVVDQDRQGR